MPDPIQSQAELPDSSYTKVKIAVLNNLAWTLRNKDEKRSLVLSEAAYALARQQLPDSAMQEQLAYSLTTLAYINHYYKADFELALSQALEAVALFEQAERVKGLPAALNIAGLSLVRLGDPSEAMEYHLRALRICEAFGDRMNEAEVYNHLAIVYVYWGEHQQALEYFGKSLALHQEGGNQFEQAVALLNRCMTFKDLRDYQSALGCGLQSLHLLERLETTWWPRPMALANIANVYLGLGQTKQAFYYFEQALAQVNQIEDKFIQVYVLLNVARAYYQQGDSELSRALLYQGLAIAEESKQRGFQFEYHELLAQLFKAEGNFEKALAHYEKFHQLNREVFNEQSDRRLKNLLVRHRTELAQQEAQVYQLKNVELEREIMERHQIEAKLHKTNIQLTQLNTHKDKLLSIVAHDLRSPFAPLLSLAQLLVESVDELDPVQIRQVAQSILASAYKVYDLLETLLDWSRIQLGRLEYQPTQLKLYRVVESNVQLFLPTAQEKNITLQHHVAPDIIVWADQYMLDTAIRNLISNALKFTPCGGTVTLKADHSSQLDWVEVSVSDTGIGISPQDLAKLFKIEENYHTHGTAQEKGTGLGLIICKEMVERNKGRLAVTSQVGAGTTFTLTVPRRPL